MTSIKFSLRSKLLFNIMIFLMAVFAIQIAFSYIVIFRISLNSVENTTDDYLTRVETDIKYENGIWNTESYLADPLTPYPNGSSGYTNPLYIISTDGFVIERNSPINGFLDSSDFKHLSSFTKPQNVKEASNESWRVLSRPITFDNDVKGIVMVSVYNPNNLKTEDIDSQLLNNIGLILSKVKLSDSSLDISDVDIRNIHYNVSFEIVDKFNKVLLNNGRVPVYIDPSYVQTELHNNERIITDQRTGDPFYVKTHLLKDDTGRVTGIIVSGSNLKTVFDLLKKYFVIVTLLDLVLAFPMAYGTLKLLKPKGEVIMQLKSAESGTKTILKTISFDKKRSVIYINNTKIAIPFASNQYYLCEAIFGNPKKRWEQDELLERMGEEIEEAQGRKVYDACLAVNKKTGLKIIKYEDKTYSLNEDYLPLITS